MARNALASEVVASLTALERERGSITELQYLKRRKSILSKLTSRSGLSNESTIGVVILVQAVIGGAILLGLKLSPESQVAIGVPALVVAVVVVLVVVVVVVRDDSVTAAWFVTTITSRLIDLSDYLP